MKLNYIRTFPVYLCFLGSKQRKLIEMDMDHWTKVLQLDSMRPLARLNYLLSDRPEFRNLLLHRFWNPTRTAKGKIHALITRFFWKPVATLYICTREIGGGLFIQHGFATMISAKRIGENCWINQQVTIGYKGDNNPVIEDNVKILCGAKVLGNVTMHSNSVAGANAVVVKDVPENAVVGGVPAHIIKFNGTETKE